MAIITFNEIIEVNGILEQKHLNFTGFVDRTTGKLCL